MRTKITKEILIDRLKKKFSNEDGTLIELNTWKLVNDFLKEVRRVAVEYKFYDLPYTIFESVNDNIWLEYTFRHESYRDKRIEFYQFSDWRFSEYIDWCYSIGMSEKNQIRKRLEFFDPRYIEDNKGIPLTKIMRKYRELYKNYYGKE